MNELSERARKLAQQLDALSSRKQQQSLIEQALLAERRLAMEEAQKLVDARRDPDCFCDACDECTAIAQALRAAAEKEVVK